MRKVVWASDDKPASVEDEGLSPYEQTVRQRWERFCPNLVTSLLRSGGELALQQAIRNVCHEEERQLRLLEYRTGLHRQQLEELTRSEVSLPPGESDGGRKPQ